jgi:hypothetical protein
MDDQPQIQKPGNDVFIGGQKYERDRISAVTWAFILIWAGLVFLATNTGFLEQFSSPVLGLPEGLRSLTTWSLIFMGAGVILLLEVLARIILPHTRHNFVGSLILAVVFIGIGMGQHFSWSVIGPIILIALGLSFLIKGVFKG